MRKVTERETHLILQHIVNKIEENKWEEAKKPFDNLDVEQVAAEDRSIYWWANARFHHRSQNFAVAEKQYLLSIALAKKTYEEKANPTDYVRGLSSIGLFYSQIGEAHKAVPYLMTANQLIDRHEIGGVQKVLAYYSKGVMHGVLDEHVSAIEWLKRAEELNVSQRLLYNGADIHIVMGICYHKLSHFEEAERSFLKVLDILKIIPDERLEAALDHNLGMLYRRTGRYEEAIEHLQSAYELHQEAGRHHSTNNTTIELAKAYRLNGQLEESKRLCYKVMNDGPVEELLAEAQYALAETLYVDGQYEEALENAKLALEFFKKAPNRLEFVNKTYELMVNIYEIKCSS
ncbi:tetratricopeptide repeat protein [Brevibacillus agri]|uniref:tetratricopeptide repeat protein n=1 Tax=Brevibacillus agri TaxID=51101 RepID=UPI00046F68EF|nr:tetratricopeptide repeat protein [Brevibacillus agri]WHX28288.1 tetratricopeptide repeat protein [Brevibacillus agri]